MVSGYSISLCQMSSGPKGPIFSSVDEMKFHEKWKSNYFVSNNSQTARIGQLVKVLGHGSGCGFDSQLPQLCW